MIATLGTLLTGNALAWYNPYLEKSHLYEYDLSAWPRFREKLRVTFGEQIWIGTTPPFKPNFTLDSATKSRTPWSILTLLQLFSLAVQQAIKVDNRLYERRLERTEVRGVTPYSSPNRFFPPTRPQPPTPRTSNTSWNQTPRRPPPPSPMVVPPPRSSNDMDIDFARRGPLTSEERQQRMSRGLCLVCGQSGHLKANCPKSNPNFRAPKSIRAIQIDDVDFESPGNDPGCL
ncbi:hypothetical protein BASA83_011166 [Batrachochytrium salamandrivorans]|nr:hypothetical protein BASA83_011166 [Batrachochytrium salamandrivorans]